MYCDRFEGVMEEFTDSKFKWLRTGIPRHMTPSGLDTTPARLLREKCRRGDHQQPTCGEVRLYLSPHGKQVYTCSPSRCSDAGVQTDVVSSFSFSRQVTLCK